MAELAWDRIEKIIKHYGLGSLYGLIEELGTGSARYLCDIDCDSVGIDHELANTIHSRYPELGRIWILTGKGRMLPDRPIGDEDPPSDKKAIRMHVEITFD